MANASDVEQLPELMLMPPGSKFGNYVVHECIGQGAMGNVYRAEHALLEKPVALKVMDSSLLSNSDARARFLREGQAAAAIKHPNVVDITDVGVYEGTPYLVMELLVGEDLQVYLERRKLLSEREIASILIPITAALGAAHDRGVVHRDLKPSNIFLSRGPDGEVIPKILDFGISKIGEAITNPSFESTPFNQLLGSPLYLPPEAVRGSRDLTAKSDQYSIGVVLYECVTGKPPFAGDSLVALLNAISSGDFVRPNRLRPDISVAMEHAILRAMNPDPALRFEHIRELGSELLEVAGMRTQMLWGRTFGRIDLSEPPFSPRSTAPMALLRMPSHEPAPLKKPRSRGYVWVGGGVLLALLLSNLWALREFGAQPASPAAAWARAERAPELAPPRGSVAEPGGGLPRAVAATELAGTPPSGEPAPTQGSGAEPAGAAPEPESGERQATLAGAVASGATAARDALPPVVLVDRPRPPKRARPLAAGEPRPRALGPELPARAGLVQAPDRRPDEIRELFLLSAPGREGSSRGVSGGSVGANESPILD